MSLECKSKAREAKISFFEPNATTSLKTECEVCHAPKNILPVILNRCPTSKR